MLGRTAGGLFWMFRYLERAENTARLIDAGHRIALTRASAAEDEWRSIAATAGVLDAFIAMHGEMSGSAVTDYLLAEPSNPSSVYASIKAARDNARLVRTALTREVWEAMNEAYLLLKDALAEPTLRSDLPETLSLVRHLAAQVRGAFYGTMLRNDIYSFCQAGAMIERADNTARILDVKYYVLLPSPALVGSRADNVQWDMILRAVSAQRSYRWLNGDVSSFGIAEFLIFDCRMPRSLAFCYDDLVTNLRRLENEYAIPAPSTALAVEADRQFNTETMEAVFSEGLHEFLVRFIAENGALASAIENDYRFYE
ncbi:MAG: alpha-E domain-containing protein [Parvularculaceae bacterium]